MQSGSTKEENPYSLPSEHKAKARKDTVSPKTEYSYAKPDSKRATTVESDRLVIGEVTTTKKDDEEMPQGNSENPYTAPDEVKPKNARSVTLPSEYSYARPNVKREMEISGDRLVTGTAAMTAQKDDIDSKPNDENDENPYALPDKKKTQGRLAMLLHHFPHQMHKILAPNQNNTISPTQTDLLVKVIHPSLPTISLQ